MKRRSKWKIKRIIGALIVLTIIVSVLIYLYIGITPYGKLRKLDYSKDAIAAMNDEVREEIIEYGKFSKTVEVALLEKRFIKSNLELYFKINYEENKDFIKNINKLEDLGYEDDSIIKMYKNLSLTEIQKIIKVGYVKEIDEYLNISYFRASNLNRYRAYKTKTEKSYELVVTEVNIGLDYEYYDEEIVKTVKDTNDILILINKYNKLPNSYEPQDLVKISKECSKEKSYLRKEAAKAFEKMCAASVAEGYGVLALSAYRSIKEQQEMWDDYMKAYGASYTYYYVAKPGFSEHHTGLAVDLASGSNPKAKFSYTKDYTWVLNNGYKYGFIMRYEETKERLTGYNFEPWHVRYVGVEVATYIHNHEITFDEYIATK